MKTYEILKTFNGSQDGLHTEPFTEGTTAQLSDALAEVVLKEGWVKPVDAIESRETKVTGPAETKPAKALNKMSKAELVAHGLTLGLELVPDSMNVKDMLAAIEAHTAA